ncbi:MAG: GHKL domain-containing protein [Eubacteriales bacterium]|nr:GHKL domain-containing protein [Eubacteriales bacterium]
MAIFSNPKILSLLLFLPGLALSLFGFRLPKQQPWRFFILAMILSGLGIAAYFYHLQILFLGGGLCLTLFSLFYDDEPFPILARYWLPYLVISCLAVQFVPLTWTCFILPATAVALMLKFKQFPLPDIALSLLLLLPYNAISNLALKLISLLLASAVVASLYIRSLQTISNSTEMLQRQIMASQYQEIKEIYLQMRGWRHDYHSHIQTEKAYLESGQIEALRNYLNLLEQDLISIDLLVNSANPLVDAIFNSKLSLAKSKSIDVDAKVTVLGDLPIKDTDLCIMFGNLLDNAIEACEEIPPEDRFIRIYCDTFGQQLYLSIQNSAKEILSFEERNYISTKRGHHGLGMKRVALLVDQYKGYLNLQNEPGVFAAELTLPLGPGSSSEETLA